MKESRLFPSKPRSRPHSCQAEVLAWESCCPNIGIGDVGIRHLCDVALAWGAGPVLFKDVTAKRLDLALECNAETGPLKTEVQPADSCEKRGYSVCQRLRPLHPVHVNIF